MGVFDVPKRPDIKLLDGRVLYNATRLRALFGISPAALVKWTDKGCPKQSVGWYDLEDVLQWRGCIGGRKSPVDSDDEDGSSTLQEQKMRADIKYKRAQGELAEIKRDFANDKYIERSQVVADLGRFFDGLRATMRNIPARLGVELAQYMPPHEARRATQRIAEDVDKALTGFVLGHMEIEIE